MNAYWMSGCIPPRIFYLSTGWRWVILRPGRFTSRERAPGTHCIAGWVGPTAGLDAVVKRNEGSLPCYKKHSTGQYAEPDESSPQALTILISSSQLRLGLPGGVFPSGFPTKTFYAILISPMHVTYLVHI